MSGWMFPWIISMAGTSIFWHPKWLRVSFAFLALIFATLNLIAARRNHDIHR